ncbi:MAG: hypothetical protein HY033_11215 [Ignavibacteriae bacterium]|nr:hypothetical protein [Ignavibacteria bacterium]MBI3365468.1 hypothetical protein [Ignavibacteriota bacterium]
MNSTYSLAVDSRASIVSDGLWLRSKAWDLTFISLSATLVAIPFLTYYFANEASPFINKIIAALGVHFTWDEDASRNLVNGVIALFIGGPHMYATYTRTALDKNFSRKHKALLSFSLLIPVGVVYLGVNHFQLLITFFFFWASIHILHQAAFIVECYNRKSTHALSWSSRMIDYGVLFTALYPVATYKFIHDEFFIGSNNILFPEFLKNEYIFYLVTAVFAASVILFVWKTVYEIRSGTAHYPKILLISLTAGIAFIIPAFRNLDVAFQGFNTWHSFQYLGLTYYINRLRHERGEIGTKFIDKMSEDGKTWSYYFFTVGLTVGAVGVIALLIYFSPVLGLTFDQCYYIVVLSFLLTHYLHDHLLFTKPEEILLNT